MHLKSFVVAAAVAGALSSISLPAMAQGYRDCAPANDGRQAAGAVIGGVIGGLAGSGIASRKNREEGGLLGALVGAVAGSEISRQRSPCLVPEYNRNEVYADPRYSGSDQYYTSTYDNDLRGGRGDYDVYAPPYADDRYPPDYHDRRRNSLADTRGAGTYRDVEIARECRPARQKTRLPDGSVETRTVEACRSAVYGDWTTQD